MYIYLFCVFSSCIMGHIESNVFGAWSTVSIGNRNPDILLSAVLNLTILKNLLKKNCFTYCSCVTGCSFFSHFISSSRQKS